MNYQDCKQLLTSQSKFHINLGLERMEKLALFFSNPQNKLRVIHVAGTNGKGSTCAMLAKICEENGYKTGLFTSPHLKKYNERIKINGIDISDEDFAKYLSLVEKTAKENNIELTEFELLTMMAFLYFKDKETDVVILETGMGGRLDATNIVQEPLLTIITSINLDHTDRLGQTIEAIAFEKAGILKENIPVIISKNNLGIEIIKKEASKVGAGVFEIEDDFKLINEIENVFSNGFKKYKISLKGIQQGQNLALVDAACEYLTLEPTKALKNVIWPCRMQYIQEQNILIDAAHNPDAIKFLKKNIDIYFPNKKRAFLFGMLDTKDYTEVIKNLFNNDDEIFITDNFAHNAIKKEILNDEIAKFYPFSNRKFIDINEISKFAEYYFSGIKIACGSFYLCEKLF